MSRAKLIRALLAAASLLGALPLMAMAQGSAATSAAAPAFPFGRYALVACDSAHGPPPGLVVEFTATTIKVLSGEQVIETSGMTVDGTRWQIFEFGGNCLDAGDYRWHEEGNVLWMELINDPCADRAERITSVRLIRQ